MEAFSYAIGSLVTSLFAKVKRPLQSLALIGAD